MKGRLVLTVVILALLLAVLFSGCGKRDAKRPPVTMIPFQFAERNGALAMQFTNWTIVFEAIPSRVVNIGETGVLTFAGGAASSGGNSLRGLQFRQFAGKDGTIVSVNNYTFKVMNGAARITFNDHFYELKPGPKVIVVAKDGKTHEAPNP